MITLEEMKERKACYWDDDPDEDTIILRQYAEDELLPCTELQLIDDPVIPIGDKFWVLIDKRHLSKKQMRKLCLQFVATIKHLRSTKPDLTGDLTEGQRMERNEYARRARKSAYFAWVRVSNLDKHRFVLDVLETINEVVNAATCACNAKNDILINDDGKHREFLAMIRTELTNKKKGNK